MEEAMEKRPESLGAVLPNELMPEILSWLPVESLMRFRCVNISFKTLISQPYFVQMHLTKSKRNPHLTAKSRRYSNTSVVAFQNISRLLEEENQSTTINYDPYYRSIENCNWWIVGSCNGLLCLIDMHTLQLFIWNPATQTNSEIFDAPFSYTYQFSFGYDDSTATYKVVAFHLEVEHGNAICAMKVFSLGDNYWRNIQCLPVLPLYKFNSSQSVYLSGTINWLALRDYICSDNFVVWNDNSIAIQQLVILSLDLSTETYTQLLLPRGFDKVPHYQPTLVFLRDTLCFFHDFDETHFVIWQMKDFGVQESWIQLFKICYNNLFSCYYIMGFNVSELLPLYLSKNVDTLVLANGYKTFIYNCKDNIAQEIGITNEIYWSNAKDYVESLVPTH